MSIYPKRSMYQPRWGSPLARETSIDDRTIGRNTQINNNNNTGQTRVYQAAKRETASNAAAYRTTPTPPVDPKSYNQYQKAYQFAPHTNQEVEDHDRSNNDQQQAVHPSIRPSVAKRAAAAKAAFEQVRNVWPEDSVDLIEESEDDSAAKDQQNASRDVGTVSPVTPGPKATMANVKHPNSIGTESSAQNSHHRDTPAPISPKYSTIHTQYSTYNPGYGTYTYDGTMPPMAPTPSIFSSDQAYQHYLEAVSQCQHMYPQPSQHQQRIFGPRPPDQPHPEHVPNYNTPGQDGGHMHVGPGGPETMPDQADPYQHSMSMSLDENSSLVRDYMLDQPHSHNQHYPHQQYCPQHHQYQQHQQQQHQQHDAQTQHYKDENVPQQAVYNEAVVETTTHTNEESNTHQEHQSSTIKNDSTYEIIQRLPFAALKRLRGVNYQVMLLSIIIPMSAIVLAAVSWYLDDHFKSESKSRGAPNSTKLPKINASNHVFLAAIAALTIFIGLLRLMGMWFQNYRLKKYGTEKTFDASIYALSSANCIGGGGGGGDACSNTGTLESKNNNSQIECQSARTYSKPHGSAGCLKGLVSYGPFSTKSSRIITLVDILLLAFWILAVSLVLFGGAKIQIEKDGNSNNKDLSKRIFIPSDIQLPQPTEDISPFMVLRGRNIGIFIREEQKPSQPQDDQDNANNNNSSDSNNKSNEVDKNNKDDSDKDKDGEKIDETMPSFDDINQKSPLDLRNAACFISPAYPGEWQKTRQNWKDYPAICKLSMLSSVLGYIIACLFIALVAFAIGTNRKIIKFSCFGLRK
ncbi:hypothetical protein H4219_001786 [Mycoemilia scoparia]|uniref:Uncharacterized protein n=1 Tax=Mycoemilia scoparia TaxID=417184 RepID=A0A9W8DRG2_9FUNG|nr:hypothetical protein H4219_001786 [Mycoemilia scoparia]